MNTLMKYIPKEYKNQVKAIYRSEKVWNTYTKRWNTMITVELEDGDIATYQNAMYMKEMLNAFGR